MKRILAIALALRIALPIAAGAEGLSSNRGTLITAVVDEAYTIVIPPSLNVTFNAASTDLPMEVTLLRLGSGRRLEVRPSVYDGTLTSGANILRYKLMNGSSEFSAANPLIYNDIGTRSLELTIARADWNSAVSGSYTDTVTFAVAIASAP